MDPHHTNGSSHTSKDDGSDRLSALMMAAIPRRSLPPRASPTEPDPAPGPAPETPSDALENMTIPRRSLKKKPSITKHELSGGGGGIQSQTNLIRRTSDGSDRDRDREASSSRPSRPKPKHVSIQSEYPFVVKIKMKDVSMDTEGIPRFRASARTPKRARPSYEELQDTDEDDLIDSGDEAYGSRPKKLRRGSHGSTHEKKSAVPSYAPPAPPSDPDKAASVQVQPGSASGAVVATAANGAPVIDSPPEGELSTLWYSSEYFLHLFVVEKIVGWKRRHVTTLEWEDPNALKFLDPAEASATSQRALSHPEFWNDPRKRMEVSRINVTQCPVVMTIAAEREKAAATETNANPKYTLKVSSDEREEVLLVKWRGRSHLHCSWERPYDIQKLDPSNSTARNKIRRYYQSQEAILGLDWKKVLEEERATAAAIQSHGEIIDVDTATEQVTEGEEFFPPQCVEVERILDCDETEMDMQVLAKQRALNIRAEQKELELREEAEARGIDGSEKTKSHSLAVKDLVDIHKPEEPWDPEDNVRYIVKWKGLPVAEITWEYWRDIKRDAVEQAEDFWYRQKPPSPDEVSRFLNKPHPHVKDFRKLQALKSYGISSKPRPVADLGDGAVIPEEDKADSDKGFQLRSYQLEGVNWLLFNWWNKRSCILADEMGLGKTVQTLGFLQELCTNPNTETRGPFLIVAPLSLIGQWQSEAKGWAPDFNVVLYHGSAPARDFLVRREFYFNEEFVGKGVATKLRKQHITKFHVLITTYELILKDIDVLSRIKWKTLIVDEAHRLKNPESKLFADLASVPRDYCVLLTGTPLANNTEELWALLHFDDPKAFHDKDDFLEKFGQLSDSAQVNELHSILKPYLLRRVKEDVEKSLPPKEETILEVSLTPIQKQYYKAIYERNTTFLYKGAKPNNAPSLMNVMMELRKICNHPYLVKGVEDKILTEASAKAREEKGKDEPIDYVKLFGEQLVKSSGKMVLMEKLLLKLFSAGHKVLIFSQMVRALDLLEEFLKIKRYRYERLDGSTSSSSRASAVDRFNRKSCQRFVMLLSTRAGGLGLNLTSADIVIIFDSDWNPQNDLQAMARAHRIGQTRKVQIFRLLTAKTYEMHMFHSASMKLGLERAVLSQQREQGDETDENSQKKAKTDKEAHAKEIDELLKKGAYDVFRDDDDEEAKKFMESDIDQLLERSAKTVTYGASAESLGSGLGSFSKASFVTDTGEGEKDVDLDDPDFWAKAVGLEAPVETPEDVAQMLDDGVKRSRKQVQQFDPYAESREAERLKQEKIAMQLQAEKEEKERLRMEKRKRKKEAKEKRKREREESQSTLPSKDKTMAPAAPPKKKKDNETKSEEETTKKVDAREVIKPKKAKKSDRKRAFRRAANEDPVIERLKQGWEVAQRNRATAAALRFGFGRFNKMRHESNLTSLPLQDLEVFVRSYTYQITLQVAVSFLSELQKSASTEERDFRSLVQEWMGPGSEAEVNWLCKSIYSAMKLQFEVQSCRRFLRIPLVLAEPPYVAELRRGAAFRALRRMGILARLSRVIDEALDSVLSVLGHEELAKRGCGTNDLSTLDADLRARHVSTEELSLATGVYYREPVSLQSPAVWWDRNCDIALLVGTFVHGLGNYEAMRNDDDLPFAHHIRVYAESDEACCAANRAFQAAAFASKTVFESALERAKAKAASEVQAAVAAAAATASEREQDAVALRQGGAAADAVLSNLSDSPEEPMATKSSTVDDLHFVTLSRLQEAVVEAVRNDYQDVVAQPVSNEVVPLPVKSEDDNTKRSNGRVKKENGNGNSEDDKEASFAVVSEETLVPGESLPMPDSRVLNRRFIELLNHAEASLDNESPSYTIAEAGNRWEANGDVLTNREVRSNALSSLFVSRNDLNRVLSEYCGIGINGSQCGSTHRSLDDGSDFSLGAASSDLSQIAHGTDAPRYLRALGVPMNLTRFAIAALVYADPSTVQQMLTNERIRNNMQEKTDGKLKTIEPAEVKAESAKSESKIPIDGKPNTETENDEPVGVKAESESEKPIDGEVKTETKTDEPAEVKAESKGEVKTPIDGKLKTETKTDEPAEVEAESKAESETPIDGNLKTQSKTDESAEGNAKSESQVPIDGASEENNPASIDAVTQTLSESKEEAPPSHSKESPSDPLEPIELVSLPFRANARLRAAVASALLLYGYPCPKLNGVSVDGPLWTTLREQGGAVDEKSPEPLFSIETFMRRVKTFLQGEEIPDCDAVQDYVERVLLPHCLRLSVQGNGSVLRNARGSKGEYETALGVSQYPEPSKEVQSPLPDPCLPLCEQSLEAVAYACAILRRVRLMRAALHIASGKISVEGLDEAARSSFMCKNMDGLPLWWCPWVHDVALLVHAATNGLFAIVRDHHNDIPGSVFSRKAIVNTMYSTFVADEKALSKTIAEQSNPDSTNEWIDLHAKEFPTANVMERRLAFLCTQATKSLPVDLRYDNIPMFDHGGWPRA